METPRLPQNCSPRQAGTRISGFIIATGNAGAFVFPFTCSGLSFRQNPPAFFTLPSATGPHTCTLTAKSRLLKDLIRKDDTKQTGPPAERPHVFPQVKKQPLSPVLHPKKKLRKNRNTGVSSPVCSSCKTISTLGKTVSTLEKTKVLTVFSLSTFVKTPPCTRKTTSRTALTERHKKYSYPEYTEIPDSCTCFKKRLQE